MYFQICLGFAQHEDVSFPASNFIDFKKPIPTVEINNIIVRAPKNNEKAPVQAGYTLPISNNELNKGIWENKEGVYAWRLEILVLNAYALNLYLQNIDLKEGEKLTIYNPKKDKIIVIKDLISVCTDFIPGDRIIIELNTDSKYEELPFSIDEIGVKLGSDNNFSKGFGDAGDCEVHINCKEGEYWQSEKGGVARILVKQDNLTFWCTGSLINNTRNDGAPYFLTANHCGEASDSVDYSKWLFYFNFESESCVQPVFEPEFNTLSGSTLLAKSSSGTSVSSDFKLLLLNEDLPVAYKPYYNGWDRRGIASQTGVTIHHPQGDVKMISTYEDQLVSTKYDNNNPDPNGMYWQVRWAETQNGHGVTEGGSSGSPIFNSEGNIVGSLTGGGASCDYLNEPDYYGKLSYSWESKGVDSTTSLAYWLDPMGTGISILKGTNLDSTNIYAGFSGEPNSIIVGESVTFINTSFGNINGYSWYFEGGTPEFSELKEPGDIKYLNAGEFNVQLIVSSADGSDTLIGKDYIRVLPNISPNPSMGKVKIAFGGEVPEDYQIIVFNSMGQKVKYMIDEISDDFIIVNLFPNRKGTYLVKLTSSQINNTYKVILIGH